MATPRPPGVRRANDYEDNSYMHVTSPPTLLAWYPWARRASLRSHALAPLSHIALASEPACILVAGSLYRLGQRRRWPTVRRKIFCLGLKSTRLRHPWRRQEKT